MKTFIQHAFHCLSRELCVELDINDVHHRISHRISITTSGPGIRYINDMNNMIAPTIGSSYISSLAAQISYVWNGEQTFNVFGPSTQYFRIVFVFGESIVARLDVLYDKMNLVITPNQHVKNMNTICPADERLIALKLSYATQLLDIVFYNNGSEDVESSKTISFIKTGYRSIEIDRIGLSSTFERNETSNIGNNGDNGRAIDQDRGNDDGHESDESLIIGDLFE